MNKKQIENYKKSFDSASHMLKNQNDKTESFEIWHGRELMTLLGYQS